MLYVVVLSFISAVSAAKLPTGVKVCSRSNPNINDCIRDAIQASIHVLSPGIDALNLEILDPLYINNLVVDKKKNDGSPVDIDFQWNDVYIKGINSAKIVKAFVDWKDGIINFEGELSDPVDIKGNYTVDGIVLILPLKGSGTFEIKLEGFKAHVKVHGHEETRSGDLYFNVDRLAFTFDVSHMEIKYENLFSGDPTLGTSMNAFLNENWRDILQEMTPAIEASFSSHFQQVAANFFNKVPLSEIAPP